MKLPPLFVKLTCGVLVLARFIFPFPCFLIVEIMAISETTVACFSLSRARFFNNKVYSEPCQTSWKERFAKIFNDWESLFFKYAETLKRYKLSHCSKCCSCDLLTPQSC